MNHTVNAGYSKEKNPDESRCATNICPYIKQSKLG
jgi:hypothetical protein